MWGRALVVVLELVITLQGIICIHIRIPKVTLRSPSSLQEGTRRVGIIIRTSLPLSPLLHM